MVIVMTREEMIIHVIKTNAKRVGLSMRGLADKMGIQRGTLYYLLNNTELTEWGSKYEKQGYKGILEDSLGMTVEEIMGEVDV